MNTRKREKNENEHTSTRLFYIIIHYEYRTMTYHLKESYMQSNVHFDLFKCL